MKKSLILVLLAGTTWSCNDHKTAEHKNFNNVSDTVEHHQEATDEKLELNSGAKWKVDAITNANINDLNVILKKFDAGRDRSLSAYKEVQSDLQKGTNKVIIECKMKGADHLALHKWLEPLIMQVAKFKQASTVPEAAENLGMVRKQLVLYGQYFEL